MFIPTEGRRPREVYHTNFCFPSDTYPRYVIPFGKNEKRVVARNTSQKKKWGLSEQRPKSGVFGNPFLTKMQLHATEVSPPKMLSRGTS
jgi:hypothetical protein